MTWDAFLASVEEAAELARPGDFDHLALISDGYPVLRRYAPEFLDAFEFRATPATEELLKAIALLRDLNAKMPGMSPTMHRPASSAAAGSHTSSRARRSTAASTRLCVLSELRNALRSGDLWVVGQPPVTGLRGVSATGGVRRR